MKELMTPLFSKRGLRDLNSVIRSKVLCAFDFDGTLSKVVSSHSAAKISNSTLRLLLELNEKVPVAIVSGRSLSDLKKRIGYRFKYMIGNHGIEGAGKAVNLRLARAQCLAWKKQLPILDWGLGAEIEDKIYSLSLHYRQSKNKKQTKNKIIAAVKKISPAPRIIYGKSLVNIVPKKYPHKGNAVLKIKKAAKCERVLYVGDDDTDEDVFRLSSSKVMGIRVGKKSKTRARYYIKTQSQINSLLKLLIKAFKEINV